MDTPIWPANDLVAITKSDATVYDPPLRSIYAGSDGNIAVVTQAGTTVTFTAVNAGSIIGPFYVSRVLNATTCTNLVGFK